MTSSSGMWSMNKYCHDNSALIDKSDNLRKKLRDGRTGGDALYPRRLVLREVILCDFGTLYPIFHLYFRSLKPRALSLENELFLHHRGVFCEI